MLEEVEALLASRALVVDACRQVVRDAVRSFRWRASGVVRARTALGEAWPGDVPRGTLLSRVHSERSSAMNRIARGCESKSGGFARYFDTWLT